MYNFATMANTTLLSVQGMTCSSCAQGITRQLEKKGLKKVNVHYESGEVEFELGNDLGVPEVINEINSLGYKASLWQKPLNELSKTSKFSILEIRFFISAFFTIPLLLHMFLHFELLHNILFQFLLCIPVLIIGIMHFGKSAWGSLKAGIPNMDVLIATGSITAFIYSCLGWYFYFGNANIHHFIFFETTATIISLVLLGNIIEQKSLVKTQSALLELTKLQPQIAHRITEALTVDEHIKDISVDQLKINDLVLVKNGERIPADGQIYWGHATIDEASMTGESIGVEKTENDQVLAGTTILDGSIKFFVQKAGNETVLSAMIDLVKRASSRKPQIQRIGDLVSSRFVPIVILISLLTFTISYFFTNVDLQHAILRSVAVLVISCPCAMGLATPTAVSVGIGRAAKSGILIKGGDSLERLSEIDTIVFDKTGTLTEGKLRIKSFNVIKEKVLVEFLLGTLEQHSSHPVAQILSKTFSNSIPPYSIQFTEIKEEKGIGIFAIDKNNNHYVVGSNRCLKESTVDKSHQVYILKNDEVLATIDLEDSPKDGIKMMVDYFRSKNIKTILLSGDSEERCEGLAIEYKISTVYANKLPIEKIEIIRELQKSSKVAMVGDGINDAPSIAESWIGISMGSGTQVAINSSDIILLNHLNLSIVVKAHQIALATLKTIRQNLFWALIYNIIAIPVAAFGFLSPMIASFSMAFSDVIVIGNSLRLKLKKIKSH